MPDFDYVLVKGVVSDKSTGVSFARAMAIKMAGAMTKGQFSTSIENLEGVVASLTVGGTMGVPFAGPGRDERVQGGERTHFKHMVIQPASSSVKISRHWLDMVVKLDYAQIMMRAMQHCQHAHTHPRRVVTGLTYLTDPNAVIGGAVDPNYVMSPHIWQCVDVKPNPRVVLRIANSAGFDFARENGGEVTDGVFEATEDLEITEFRRRVRLLCVPDERLEAAGNALPSYVRAELRRRSAAPGVRDKHYPVGVRADYIAMENAKKAALRGEVSPDARVAPLSRATRARDDDLEAIIARRVRGEVSGEGTEGTIIKK